MTVVPGLASLLADVPRDRLVALARDWDVPTPENPGTAATLYRTMTNPAAIESVLARLPESARLVFRRMSMRAGPTRRSSLAGLVPFSEDVLGGVLLSLQHVGLIWTIQPPSRKDERSEQWWIVPADIARSSRFSSNGNRSATPPSAPEVAGSRVVPSYAPGLIPMQSESIRVAQVDSASRILDRILAGDALMTIMSESNSEAVRDVAHLGVALGVLEAHGRTMRPGPRSVAWTNLDELGRVRALTRIWTVDDAETGAVSAVVRRGILTALRDAEPERWYDANSVARLAVVQVAGTPPRPTPSGSSDQSRSAIDRSAVDRALLALAIIGTIAIALDRRKRPAAIQVTEAGHLAIR